MKDDAAIVESMRQRAATEYLKRLILVKRCEYACVCVLATAC